MCCAVLCSPVFCSVLRENLCGSWTNGAGGRARHLLSMSPDLRLGGGVAKFPHLPKGFTLPLPPDHISFLWTNFLKSSRFRVWVDYGGGSVRVGYKRVSEAAKRRKVGGACNNLLTLSSNGLSRCFRRKQDQTCLQISPRIDP